MGSIGDVQAQLSFPNIITQSEVLLIIKSSKYGSLNIIIKREFLGIAGN